MSMYYHKPLRLEGPFLLLRRQLNLLYDTTISYHESRFVNNTRQNY
jgi:hypothetical protein